LLALTGLMAFLGPDRRLRAELAGVHDGGRALIGVVIGGFWSMSAATVMRLVPEEQVPRALAVVERRQRRWPPWSRPRSAAFLGQFIGWRGAFFLVVPLACVTFAWQWLALPAMPAATGKASSSRLASCAVPAPSQACWRSPCCSCRPVRPLHLYAPFLEQVTKLGVSAALADPAGDGRGRARRNALINRLDRPSREA
jgi:MFS family permease